MAPESPERPLNFFDVCSIVHNLDMGLAYHYTLEAGEGAYPGKPSQVEAYHGLV